MTYKFSIKAKEQTYQASFVLHEEHNEMLKWVQENMFEDLHAARSREDFYIQRIYRKPNYPGFREILDEIVYTFANLDDATLFRLKFDVKVYSE